MFGIFPEKVIDFISLRLSLSITRGVSKDGKTQAIILYGIKLFLCEMVKFIPLLLIFEKFGKTNDFIIAVLFMASLRVFMGGSHRETILGCFLQSVVIFGFIVISVECLVIDRYLVVSCMILCILTCRMLCPVVSDKRGTYPLCLLRKIRFKGILIIILLNAFILAYGREKISAMLCICEVMQIIDVLFTIMKKEGLKNEY